MLGLEPLLRARLAEVPDLVAIYGAPELAALDYRVEYPCAYVVWSGYRVSETTAAGKAARVGSRWQVIVAVHNPLAPTDGAAARAEVAPLVRAVLVKLLGWQAGYPYGPLTLADPADPTPAPRAGILHFPLAVTSEVVLRGEPLT